MQTRALLETVLMVVPVATLLILGTAMAVTSDVGEIDAQRVTPSRLATMARVVIHLLGALAALFFLQILIGFRLYSG